MKNVYSCRKIPNSCNTYQRLIATNGRMKGVGHALACKQDNVADGEITENVSATKALSAHRSVCQLTKALDPVSYCSLPATRGHLFRLLKTITYDRM